MTDRLTPEREAESITIRDRVWTRGCDPSQPKWSRPNDDVRIPRVYAWPDLAAALDAIDALRAERERYEKAIRWALGEEGDFPPYPGPRVMQNGMKLHQYWYWRSELRARAALPGGTK